MRLLVPSLCALSLVACASTSPDRGFRDVRAEVAGRIGQRVEWNRDAQENPEVEKAVHALLGKPLTVEGAVRVALLENRNLAATFEELAISQADVVQAGLLKNPSFRVGMTTAEGDRLDPNLTLGVTWDFLDALLIPAKKKIAAAQFEATRRRVANAVLDLASEVERAFYRLQAAQQIAAMRQIVAEAGEASVEIARAQSEAGNSSALDLANQTGAQQQFVIDRARAQAELVEAREGLTSLMGLWGAEASFQVVDRLRDIPADDPPLQHLESQAVAGRLDLEALRNDREAVGRMLSLVKSSRYTPGVGVGLEGGRLNDGHIALAPSAELELPIFDQKQAVVARVEALFRQADDRLRARAVEVRAEVRAARDRMVFARSTVTLYRSEIIPVRERVVALSQEQYDSMLLGVYQLLSAKQAEVSAYREYIEATRDYWLARVDLERAVGGKLPPAPPRAAAAPGAERGAR